MINLIPTAARRRITREYWVRVASVWLLALAVSLAAVACVLVPSYVLITNQEAAFGEAAAAAKLEVAAVDASETALAAANTQARRILERADTPRFSDAVTFIEETSGSAITLASFQFSRGDANDIAPVRVSGQAATRQALSSFRDALTAHPQVIAVELPPSNYVNNRDLEFSMTVTVAAPDG